MYGKFDVGYRMINEKATVIPQFKPTSLEDEYTIIQPTYVTLYLEQPVWSLL